MCLTEVLTLFVARVGDTSEFPPETDPETFSCRKFIGK